MSLFLSKKRYKFKNVAHLCLGMSSDCGAQGAVTSKHTAQVHIYIAPLHHHVSDTKRLTISRRRMDCEKLCLKAVYKHAIIYTKLIKEHKLMLHASARRREQNHIVHED